jgi:sulfur carrier protein ThiS
MPNSQLCKFILNGELFLLNLNSISVQNLKAYLLLQQNSIVIEHNLRIQLEENSKTTLIKDSDKLEFISIIGGG